MTYYKGFNRVNNPFFVQIMNIGYQINLYHVLINKLDFADSKKFDTHTFDSDD